MAGKILPIKLSDDPAKLRVACEECPDASLYYAFEILSQGEIK